MQRFTAQIERKEGNLGFVIPKEVQEEQNLTAEDEVIVRLHKN